MNLTAVAVKVCIVYHLIKMAGNDRNAVHNTGTIFGVEQIRSHTFELNR